MRIRRLQIRVTTADGLHGTTIDFPDGLVLLWADNTMGKSTCLKAVLYALGMEAMLTASHVDVPLTPAVMSCIETEDKRELKVLESEVLLEIENPDQKRMAIRRTIKGTRDIHLVTVWAGPALTEPEGAFACSDYYVARPGAATQERGFHQLLAGFLGWTLPEVPTFDGHQCPLYLQCIFPFAFVEQTRGWSSLQPPLPTQFRIRELHRRSVEFILDLDAYRIASERLRLREEAESISRHWENLVGSCGTIAMAINGVVHSVPAKPVAQWPPAVKPSLLVPRNDAWLSAGQAIEQEEAELQRLLNEEIPRVAEVTAIVAAQLNEVERDLKSKEALTARVLDAMTLERAEVEAVNARLGALDEDLRRNKEVQVLRKMGSSAIPNLSQGRCPACQQAVPDSLAALRPGQAVMSLDENIKFLNDQRRTFAGVLSNARKVIEARAQQLAQLRSEVADLRCRIDLPPEN